MKLQHYLIASEHNDYKPWILSPTALVVFCVVIWGIRLLLPTAVTLAQTSIDAYDLMNRINSERSQRFIPTLTTNSKLITAANGKANDMLTRSYFSHIDPDGSYVWPRIERTGYAPYLTLGENLAMDFTSAASVVGEWMNSPTHRANIVNSKFEDQGLASIAGTYEPGHDTIVIVSLFGTLIKGKTSTSTAKPTPPTSPTPNPTPSPSPVSSSGAISISKDVKINTTTLSGHTMVNIDVMISGSPTLVTARLKSQSITVLPGKVAGEFVGSFTFDPTEDLSNQTLSIEARDKAGTKTTLEYPVSLERSVTGSASNTIAVSNEAQIIKILRIVFGILAVIYMGFLVIDAIILRRNKIKREGLQPTTHLLVFALLAAFTLFSNW